MKDIDLDEAQELIFKTVDDDFKVNWCETYGTRLAEQCPDLSQLIHAIIESWELEFGDRMTPDLLNDTKSQIAFIMLYLTFLLRDNRGKGGK